MKTYFINKDYIHRLDNKIFDDSPLEDEWQKEVYEYAAEIVKDKKFQNILDIGTGSGYKLIKHFEAYNTLGIDIPQTVEFLRKKYPTKNWSEDFKPVMGYDLVISSDVIEHIPDPDTLLDLIIECQPKLILLSTPERNLMYKEPHSGPPKNKSHVREWTMEEFQNYISSRLEIIDHFISNKKQATQVILARLK